MYFGPIEGVKQDCVKKDYLYAACYLGTINRFVTTK